MKILPDFYAWLFCLVVDLFLWELVLLPPLFGAVFAECVFKA